MGFRLSKGIYAIYVFILFTYVILSVFLFANTPIKSFPDTGSYLRTAELSVLDAEFWTAERPASVPLFFKLAGRSPNQITWMQEMLSIVCWTALAISVSSIASTGAVRIAALIVILAFSLTSDIHFWNSMILSESFNNSLFALNTALWLLVIWKLPHIKQQSALMQGVLASCLVALLGLWSMSRDSNIYVVLGISGFCLIGLLFSRYGCRILFATVMLGCGFIFILQNQAQIKAIDGLRRISTFLANVFCHPMKRLYFFFVVVCQIIL
jgi:hypothetical protein